MPDQSGCSDEAVEAAIDVICAPIESTSPRWVDEGERNAVRRQVVLVLQVAAPIERDQARKQRDKELRERLEAERDEFRNAAKQAAEQGKEGRAAAFYVAAYRLGTLVLAIFEEADHA